MTELERLNSLQPRIEKICQLIDEIEVQAAQLPAEFNDFSGLRAGINRILSSLSDFSTTKCLLRRGLNALKKRIASLSA